MLKKVQKELETMMINERKPKRTFENKTYELRKQYNENLRLAQADNMSDAVSSKVSMSARSRSVLPPIRVHGTEEPSNGNMSSRRKASLDFSSPQVKLRGIDRLQKKDSFSEQRSIYKLDPAAS
jgi:hypothetical protein